MTFEFENLMKGLDLTMDSEVLDRAFVAKVTDFKDKLAKKQLTDDEIEATDKELVEMLNKLEVIVEDDEELKAAKLKAEISEAKAEVVQAETEEALNQLAGKYLHLTVIQELIEKRLKSIRGKKEKEEKEQAFNEAVEKIKKASPEQYQSLLQEYKDDPELVKIIEGLINAKKQDDPEKELREKLLEKREWSFAELRELGINPTGNDMKVAGLKLEKEMYFNIYSIRK